MQLIKEILKKDKEKCEHLLKLLETPTLTTRYKVPPAGIHHVQSLYFLLLQYVFTETELTEEQVNDYALSHYQKIEDRDLAFALGRLVFESQD